MLLVFKHSFNHLWNHLEELSPFKLTAIGLHSLVILRIAFLLGHGHFREEDPVAEVDDEAHYTVQDELLESLHLEMEQEDEVNQDG